MTIKLSVSLPNEDVEYIDSLALAHGGNRSAAIHDIVRIMREFRSENDYAAAFTEWEESGENHPWETTSRDGLDQ